MKRRKLIKSGLITALSCLLYPLMSKKEKPYLYRKCEVRKGNKWNEIPFEQIKKGDVFRLTEPDGSPVANEFGNQKGIALEDAYPIPGPQNNWGIKSEWIVKADKAERRTE